MTARWDISLSCVGAVVAHRPREATAGRLYWGIARAHGLRRRACYGSGRGVRSCPSAGAIRVERECHRAREVATTGRGTDRCRVTRHPCLSCRHRRGNGVDCHILVGVRAVSVVRHAVGVRRVAAADRHPVVVTWLCRHELRRRRVVRAIARDRDRSRCVNQRATPSAAWSVQLERNRSARSCT